ncbi:MAG: hypothetical protein P1S46_04225 [bacterium]|nr:hypothetical protein [bacterium]
MGPEMKDMEQLASICQRSLQWAHERDYTGWEKHDALNSPFLSALSLGLKWPKIIAIQAVMRFPINLRPLLGVRKHKNPKGVALFARAWLNMYHVTGDEECLKEAQALLDWLLENPAEGQWPGSSWGYPYPWQDPGFYAPSGLPNRIVTYFAGRALVHGYEVTWNEKYLEGAREAVNFILQAPKVLHESNDMLCLSYIPSDQISMAVMDVSALCGALCAIVGKHTNDNSLFYEARRLVNWVVDKQTDYGAWFYTYPSGDSHITHDNYHTGEIVDALYEYGKYSDDDSFRTACEHGLEYYRTNLFTEEARPRWMNDRVFPYDAHGYSQGIISFTLAGDLDFAGQVTEAALTDLWNGEDRFFYQKGWLYTRKTTYMRWCQGWLVYALSEHSLALTKESN